MNNLDDILRFEMFDDGFPRLTEKNVSLINFIVQNDSNYRSDFDEENSLSTINLVKKYELDSSKDSLTRIIETIDKHNSTHLSVSGKNKGDNNGVRLTIDYVFSIKNLKERIEAGDLSLVDDIATNSIPGRYVISFASKFCTYMSRYMCNNDCYSIYDGIMADILPYYYYKYLDKKISPKLNKNNVRKNGYKWYWDKISDLIDAVKKIEGYEISRRDLDYMLWYYYKGEKNLKDSSGNICFKSRITRANECIK